MRKLFIILFLTIGFNTAFSQAPGYMGKRFSAGYGIYISPGYLGSQGSTFVNNTHEAFVEFATSKKFSVGLSAKFYQAVTNNDRFADVNEYTEYRSSTKNPYGKTRLNGRNYTLYGKFFKKRYLAPWGKYFILGIALNTYTAIYDPDQVYLELENYSTSQKYYFSEFGPTKQNFKKIDVMFGNGRSRIIADRIVLDYGYSFNVWSMLSNVANIVAGEEGNRFLSTDYMGKIGAKRAKGVNAFNIFLKVGYLF